MNNKKTILDLIKIQRYVLEGNSHLNTRSELIEKPLILSQDEYYEYEFVKKRILENKQTN